MAKKKKKKIAHYIEYALTLILFTIIKFIPLKTTVYLANYFAYTVSLVFKMRNKVILDNLKIAFPEKSDIEYGKIRDRMYRNILMGMFESIKYSFLTKEQVKKHIEVSKLSKMILERVSSEGRGAVVVGGHFGFFEGGGYVTAAHGYKATFIVANQTNKLTEKLIDEPRKSHGINIIHRSKSSARDIIKAIKDNNFIAMLSDQDAKSHGVFVDFFGKKASTHKGAAVFALKYNVPVIFTKMTRSKKDLSKHILHLEEIPYKDIVESDLPQEDKVTKLVGRYTSYLEKAVSENPYEYWWIHRRYKTKPPKEN